MTAWPRPLQARGRLVLRGRLSLGLARRSNSLAGIDLALAGEVVLVRECAFGLGKVGDAAWPIVSGRGAASYRLAIARFPAIAAREVCDR